MAVAISPRMPLNYSRPNSPTVQVSPLTLRILFGNSETAIGVLGKAGRNPWFSMELTASHGKSAKTIGTSWDVMGHHMV